MITTDDVVKSLDKENENFSALLRLNRLHWLAITISLVVTITFWQATVQLTEDKAQLRFEHEADTFEQLIKRRLAKALDVHNQDDALSSRSTQTPVMQVYTLILEGVLDGVLDVDRRLVGVRLRHSSDLLYDEQKVIASRAPRYDRSESFELNGDPWQLHLWSTPELESRSKRYLPHLALSAGLIIHALLIALFVVHSHASHRTVELASVVSKSLNELRCKNEDLERFAYVASHDLQAPLQRIQGLVDCLIEDLQDADLTTASSYPDIKENSDLIKDQTAQMRSLIKGILDYSRAASMQAGEVSDVDTRELLLRIGQMLQVSGNALVLVGELPTVCTNRIKLNQVLTNLIGNAFKYHRDRSEAVVRVSCRKIDDMYEFEVADNGPGISIEDQNRIFDLFQTAGRPQEGVASGVGLAIVKRLVESGGGTVKVHSSLGTGSRFIFQWPACESGLLVKGD